MTRNTAEPPAARTQRPVLPGEPTWRQRHLAPPPHPARADPRLVTPDGRHHRHHLGQQNNRAPKELDARAAGRRANPPTRCITRVNGLPERAPWLPQPFAEYERVVADCGLGGWRTRRPDLRGAIPGAWHWRGCHVTSRAGAGMVPRFRFGLS